MNINRISFPMSLFPEDKKISVKKGKEFNKFVATIEALYALGEEAIVRFKTLDLKPFDSLATDCACHLRALYIARLAKRFLAKPKFREQVEADLAALRATRKQIQTFYTSIDNLDDPEKFARFKRCVEPFSNSPNIEEVLRKFDLLTSISTKVHYLIMTFLLTIVKDFKQVTKADQVLCLGSRTQITEKDNVFKEVTNPKALSEHLRKLVSKEVTNSLIEKEICLVAKKSLVETSIAFILNSSFRSGSLQNWFFLQSNMKIVQGKPELPDYYTLTSAFQNALYKQIPVLFMLKKYKHLGHVYRETEAPCEIAMLLIPKHRAYFQPQGFSSKFKHSTVIVVEAKAYYENAATYLRELMATFDFMHLCQLDGAQHKQYTDSTLTQTPSTTIPSLNLEKFQNEAKKLEALREEAYRTGYAINSPNATLSLSHIFADRMENYQHSSLIRLFNESASSFKECRAPSLPRLSFRLAFQFEAADFRKHLWERIKRKKDPKQSKKIVITVISKEEKIQFKVVQKVGTAILSPGNQAAKPAVYITKRHTDEVIKVPSTLVTDSDMLKSHPHIGASFSQPDLPTYCRLFLDGSGSIDDFRMEGSYKPQGAVTHHAVRGTRSALDVSRAASVLEGSQSSSSVHSKPPPKSPTFTRTPPSSYIRIVQSTSISQLISPIPKKPITISITVLSENITIEASRSSPDIHDRVSPKLRPSAFDSFRLPSPRMSLSTDLQIHASPKVKKTGSEIYRRKTPKLQNVASEIIRQVSPKLKKSPSESQTSPRSTTNVDNSTVHN